MMVDADVVGTDETKGQTRHWLVNNVTVSGCKSPPFILFHVIMCSFSATGQNQTIDNSSALAVTEYAGPAPPEGSGPHRYVPALVPSLMSFVCLPATEATWSCSTANPPTLHRLQTSQPPMSASALSPFPTMSPQPVSRAPMQRHTSPSKLAPPLPPSLPPPPSRAPLCPLSALLRTVHRLRLRRAVRWVNLKDSTRLWELLWEWSQLLRLFSVKWMMYYSYH